MTSWSFSWLMWSIWLPVDYCHTVQHQLHLSWCISLKHFAALVGDCLIKRYLLLQLFWKYSAAAVPLALQVLLAALLCPTEIVLKAQFTLSAEFAFFDISISDIYCILLKHYYCYSEAKGSGPSGRLLDLGKVVWPNRNFLLDIYISPSLAYVIGFAMLTKINVLLLCLIFLFSE